MVQLFFSALSLILLNVRDKADKRAAMLMSGSPAIKLGFWLLFNVLPFFLPNNVVLAYGYIARVGSALFLIIQLFLLIDFVLEMNERWVAAAEEDDRNYQGMLAITVACYIACVVLVGVPQSVACLALGSCRGHIQRHTSQGVNHGGSAGMLFHWFKPAGAGSCSFNVGVITATILLFVAFTVVSISPLVPAGSLLPSAIISLYCVYLAYGALQSEPHSEVCNGLGHEIDAASGSTLAVGMFIMLLSVVYSAFKCASPALLPVP